MHSKKGHFRHTKGQLRGGGGSSLYTASPPSARSIHCVMLHIDIALRSHWLCTGIALITQCIALASTLHKHRSSALRWCFLSTFKTVSLHGGNIQIRFNDDMESHWARTESAYTAPPSHLNHTLYLSLLHRNWHYISLSYLASHTISCNALTSQLIYTQAIWKSNIENGKP